jgi:uncharacterized protein with HEPN domain
MPKDDLVYLQNMLEIALKAVNKTRDLTKTEYERDENLQLALAHLIQIIGEAARRVSERTTGKHPEIPWSNIIGMRHKVVHDYLELDEDIIWDVVTADLPKLIKQLVELIPREES